METDPVSDAEPRGPLPTFLKTSASVDRPYVRSHSPVRARVHARVREEEIEERERERIEVGGGGEGGRISGSCVRGCERGRGERENAPGSRW